MEVGKCLRRLCGILLREQAVRHQATGLIMLSFVRLVMLSLLP